MLVRLSATNAGGGFSTHAFGNSAASGPGTKHYQLWFRNTPSSFCNPETFNLSSGRSLDW